MAIHKQCGANITWAKNSNADQSGKEWLPPLEYADEGYWVDDEMVGHRVHFYKPHVCDPEQVEKWHARLERIAEVTGDAGDAERLAAVDIRAARRQADQESARRAAQKFSCPQCKAKKNYPCLNQSKGAEGFGKPTLWPHPGRLALTDWYEQRE